MRKNILCKTGEIYHIYNRGTDKRIIFEDRGDYLRFLDGLKYFNSVKNIQSLYAISFANKINQISDPVVDILAYNLLPNHFHLVVRQRVDDGISKFMKAVGGGYSAYFNAKYDRSGSLFQGRFKRKHIDNENYLTSILAYVHQNHLVHQLRDPVPKSSIQELKNGQAMNGLNILHAEALSFIGGSCKQYDTYSQDILGETIEARNRERNNRQKSELVDILIE
ncbi:MAG: transposase [Patescibacteria group bacterium]